jgi:hypothetical protein
MVRMDAGGIRGNALGQLDLVFGRKKFPTLGCQPRWESVIVSDIAGSALAASVVQTFHRNSRYPHSNNVFANRVASPLALLASINFAIFNTWASSTSSGVMRIRIMGVIQS